MSFTTHKTPREPALPYAVKLLSSRNYTARKLKEKLRARGYAVEEIDSAIDKLKEKNLLNDERFAEGFVRTRIETHPRGKSAMIRDLVARGVSGPTAKEAVNSALPAEQELELAKELVDRKARQYAALDRETRKRRLTGLLARRGFGPDTIRKVLALPIDQDLPEESD
ncbi:MAG: regulatory protein RecX [bacterium]|nr:regulatory protein RecX [bacterium]